MDVIEQLLQKSEEIEKKIKYIFGDKSLLTLAFTHRSFINEHRNIKPVHNERLEFLGDSILGMIITEFLYRNLPSNNEGDLSSLRAHIVNANACVKYVESLNIEQYLLLGKGEQANNRRSKHSIAADLFEALIGAIYLDSGISGVEQFIFSNFKDDILAIIKKPSKNWKAELQDYSQKNYHFPPEYKIVKETGPDHDKTFVVSVFVNKEEVGTGHGLSKKEAEQEAAKEAFAKL